MSAKPTKVRTKKRGDHVTKIILTTVWRFGYATTVGLLNSVYGEEITESNRKSLERKLRTLAKQKMLIQAPLQKYKKQNFYRLGNAGCDWLNERNITDAAGFKPIYKKAKDHLPPHSWKHDVVALQVCNHFEAAGHTVITDVEIRRKLIINNDNDMKKVPDLLVGKKKEGPFVAVEIEHSRKSGLHMRANAKAIAKSFNEGYRIAGWPVRYSFVYAIRHKGVDHRTRLKNAIAPYIDYEIDLPFCDVETSISGRITSQGFEKINIIKNLRWKKISIDIEQLYEFHKSRNDKTYFVLPWHDRLSGLEGSIVFKLENYIYAPQIYIGDDHIEEMSVDFDPEYPDDQNKMYQQLSDFCDYGTTYWNDHQPKPGDDPSIYYRYLLEMRERLTNYGLNRFHKLYDEIKKQQIAHTIKK